MELRKYSKRLCIVLEIVLWFSYHLVYEIERLSYSSGYKGYALFFGYSIHCSIVLDLIFYISIGVLIILMVIIE